MDLTEEDCSHLLLCINNVPSADGSNGGSESNHFSSSVFLSYLGNITLEMSQNKQVFQREL